ncbi:MAG: VOC family protein [Candidatus Binataceae bacterium]
MKLNHLALTVKDAAASRDWYIANLGLKLEFEVPDVGLAAVEDDSGFGLLLRKGALSGEPAENLKVYEVYFEVDDVDQLYSRLAARQIAFDHPPQRTAWGYGPQLRDPNGYILRFFDHRSVTLMKRRHGEAHRRRMASSGGTRFKKGQETQSEKALAASAFLPTWRRMWLSCIHGLVHPQS